MQRKLGDKFGLVNCELNKFSSTSLADAPEEEEIIAQMYYTLHQWQQKNVYMEDDHV